MAEEPGPDRQAAVCRELTKLHEQILRGTLAELGEHFQQQAPRGEITLVIAGRPPELRWGTAEVRQALTEPLEGGESAAQAARTVGGHSGWTGGEVYRLAMEEE